MEVRVPGGEYRLEALELRILLSANPAPLVPPADGALLADTTQFEMASLPTGPAATSIAYDPEAQLESLFAGSPDELTPLSSEVCEDAPAETATAAAGEQEDEAAVLEPRAAMGATASVETPESPCLASDWVNTATAEMVDTLNAANAPPLQAVGKATVLLSTPETLNGAINELLAAFDPATTNSVNQIPGTVTVGTTLGGGADLDLTNLTLVFSQLLYSWSTNSWTGHINVTATSATLFPGLLDVVVSDDGNDSGDDADAYAAIGDIDLAAGAPASLQLDDLDAAEIGWPRFLAVEFTELALNFTNFRGDDNLNSLHWEVRLTGFDTGNDALNDLLASDNPFYGLTLEGSASCTLALKEIEDTVRAASVGEIGPAFLSALAAATGSELDGLMGHLSGKLLAVGEINAGFIYHKVTLDPDGNGPLSERSAVYLAVEGQFSIGDEKFGGRSTKFNIALAISELGLLQIYVSGGPIKRFEPTTGLTIEEVHLGVRFNTTIEELQTETDYQTTAAQVTQAPEGQAGFHVTLTIDEHDLAVGDRFRIKDAGNAKYDGEFTIIAVAGNQVTYQVASDPGGFLGSANIIRLTITDPFDLRDEGLESGIAPPDSILVWRDQLDLAVSNQLRAGHNLWKQLFGEAIFGGGATLSIDPIPDTVLQLNVDLIIDTDLRILLSGNLVVLDGFLNIPAKLYADLSDLFDGSGRFLLLADIPEAPIDWDPLLVLRGEVSFETLPEDATDSQTPGKGFRIALDGGVDLNIPWFKEGDPTTLAALTLEGAAAIEFRLPAGSNPEELTVTLSVDAALSEETFGTIGIANSVFHLSFDADVPVSAANPVGGIEIWGAALLSTNFAFLHRFGLFATAEGLLRINSSGVAKPDELLTDAGNHLIAVALPARSFALRLDGSVDFRIDFDSNGTFAGAESVFLIDGIAVLEFSGEQGFNVAVFDEENGVVGPATLKIGPADSPFLQFQVFGFLAMRSRGFAANMVLTLDMSLPGALADFAAINGQFVLVVNTTGQTVHFEIPGGADDRGGASGLAVEIPRAPPASIADASLNVFDLIGGQAWAVDPLAAGKPYVFVLLGGADPSANPDAVFELGTFALRGKFSFLASFDLATGQVYLEMQFNARMQLRPLDGELLASGALKIDEQGVVGALLLGGQLSLGPLTIVGAFTLEVNSTASEQIVPRYRFDFVKEDFEKDALGNPVVQNVPVAPHTIALFAFARFKLTNSFVLQGSVSFVNDPDLLRLDLSMSMQFFSTELNVTGAARIVKTGGSEGFVLNLSATLDASTFGVRGIFDFTAGLKLQINARPGDRNTALDANDLGLARQTFRVEVSNASLTLLSVITLSGSGFVERTQGVLRMQASLSGNFLSLVSVTASAFFSSEGEFKVDVYGRVQLGPNGFNIGGEVHLLVSRLDSNAEAPGGVGPKVLYVDGSFRGSVEIFWIEFSASVGVSYNSSTGDVTLRFGVKVPRWGWPPWRTKYFTFVVANIKIVDTPEPVTLGAVSNGVLSLYTGPNAAARHLAVDDPDEAVLIEPGGVAGRITITMFGHSQTFDNVLSILISDMGDGEDSVEIIEKVDVPVTVHFGNGADTLKSSASGVVIAYGDGGDDMLEGGSGNDRLSGGLDDDFIDGKDGSDWIEGGNGDDLLIGGAGPDVISGEGGTDQIAGDLAEATIDEKNALSVLRTIGSASGGSDSMAGGEGDDILFGGSGDDGVRGEAGDDILVGDDGTATVSKAQGRTFTLSALDFSGDDTFDDAGNGADRVYAGPGGDTVTLTVMSVAVSINAGEGDDTVNVRTIGSALTINGGSGDDRVNVGSFVPLAGGTVNGIGALLTVIGDEGVDRLNVDDTGDAVANTFNLTSTMLMGLGMAEGISYATLEAVSVGLGAGSDTGNVQETSAPTTIDSGVGNDTFNVGSLAPLTGGTVNGVKALLMVVGGDGEDCLNLDDTGDTGPNAVNLAAQSVTGLGMGGGIGYLGLERLSLALGVGGDVISMTNLSVPTAINAGEGVDSLIAPAGDNTWTVTRNSSGGFDGILNGFVSFVSIEAIVGGGGDTLLVPAGSPIWTLTGRNTGMLLFDLGGVLTFSGVKNLIGGPANETFEFVDNAEIDGTIDGGGGRNTLDYSAYATNVIVNLATGTATGTAGVLNFRDVRGGEHEDLIVGDSNGNLLEGLGGADLLVGGESSVTIRDAGEVLAEEGVFGSGSESRPGDMLDGGDAGDLIFGDGVKLDWAMSLLDRVDPRFRVLVGGLICPDGVGCGVRPGETTFRSETVSNAGAAGDDDYIVGGPGDDRIFGQAGNDIIQGDGSMSFNVGAYRDGDGQLRLYPSTEASTDGDDYIEGGPGDDVIFGNLGQDDIIGGSSSLFMFMDGISQSDGADLIFGGAGTDTGRNDLGDTLDGLNDPTAGRVHARDADTIVGDNGNIFRLFDSTGPLTFNYDNYDSVLRIIPRAVELLDTAPGCALLDWVSVVDEIHGESGDDVIYGGTGDDVLFGEAQDDDLVGGDGNDWISGGTGDDGVLGDSGWICTSRNGVAEPLYGVAVTTERSISTPGGLQQATVHETGQLVKSVNLTPFSLDPGWIGAADEARTSGANDIMFGGWGNDFLHGGSGDDAISGAEALPLIYDVPVNPGDSLRWGQAGRAGEFAAYDEIHPMTKVYVDPATGSFVAATAEGAVEFMLNFSAGEGQSQSLDGALSDGDDRIFGDLGNDWLIGGTGRDHLYGGWGDDLLNVDDDLETNAGRNDAPDTLASYADLAFGGAGRDILMANTAGDRLIDWAGEFNSYLVPFRALGGGTVSRTVQPQLSAFLYALSVSDGVDMTRAADTGLDPARNGEPQGELGLVLPSDAGWQSQTGAPADPQPGKTSTAQIGAGRAAKLGNI